MMTVGKSVTSPIVGARAETLAGRLVTFSKKPTVVTHRSGQ
jgi:hypothetical protein